MITGAVRVIYATAADIIVEATHMTENPVDNLVQPANAHHRRALLALGASGLAAALAGAPAASAKQSSGKKRKRQCKRLKQSCVNQIRTYCASHGDDPADCEGDLLHCCGSCDVGAGILCVVEGFTVVQ